MLKSLRREGVRYQARHMGVSPTTISRLRQGHAPDPKTLKILMDWFGADEVTISKTDLKAIP